jgi:hypothetical protein
LTDEVNLDARFSVQPVRFLHQKEPARGIKDTCGAQVSITNTGLSDRPCELRASQIVADHSLSRVAIR